jgi:hypothetical protein
MKTTILYTIAALFTGVLMAQSPTPTPTPIPLLAAQVASTPAPVVQIAPQPLTAAQVTAFLTTISTGIWQPGTPTIGALPAGTSRVLQLILNVNPDGTGSLGGAAQ